MIHSNAFFNRIADSGLSEGCHRDFVVVISGSCIGIALGLSEGLASALPWDSLSITTGSDSKTGKKFEKPYRYIDRGFSPGTGMIRRKDKTSVPDDQQFGP